MFGAGVDVDVVEARAERGHGVEGRECGDEVRGDAFLDGDDGVCVRDFRSVDDAVVSSGEVRHRDIVVVQDRV